MFNINSEGFAIGLAFISFTLYMLALLAYFYGRIQWSVWAWRLAWVSLVFHSALSFSLIHDSSFERWQQSVAEQSERRVGRPAPEGVYFNLAILIIWGWDQSGFRTPLWLRVLFQIFIHFMMVNATLIFGAPERQAFYCIVYSFVIYLGLRRWAEWWKSPRYEVEPDHRP